MKKKIIFIISLNFILWHPFVTAKTVRNINKENFKYRTSFANCSTKAAGRMAMKIVKTFEKDHSLWDVKKKIIREKLKERSFVSSYKVSYDPLRKLLLLDLNCPEALMKVQVFKEDGRESYDAVLVSDGSLYDPTYEVLLRSEKKIDNDLPFLALPVEEIDKNSQLIITELVKGLNKKFRKKLAEIILNDSKDLTIILSINGYSSSAFLGQDDWMLKMDKLKSIIKYMEAKKKIPAIINLTNLKKVVVKFSDKS